MIPQIIMQTWKTSHIPDHWLPSVESIKQFMPAWKYYLLNDDECDSFMKLYFPSLLEWFRNLQHPIQRADVIRYAWLYVHGGMYLDLDIEIVASLDELFVNGELFLLKAPRNFAGHYTNFFMASSKKNPFWIKVLEECVKPLDPWIILPHHVISQQTGLGALSRAISAWNKPFTLLPFNSLVPCDYCNPDECSKPYNYFKFLKGQSWNGIDTRIMNFAGCNPDIIITVIIVSILFLHHKLKRRLKLQ